MDLLFQGGRVLTMDALNRISSGVAVRDGRIVAVGDRAEVANAVGPDATVVPLQGRALIPGFCDAHNHFSMTMFEPRSVDCSMPPLGGKADVLETIAAAARGAPAGQWIWGLGYNAHDAGENGGLVRGELDEVAPANPVCIMDRTYHACYANSAALALCEIDARTPDPPGGEILRDAAGEPTGVLWERAMDPVHHRSMRTYLDTFGPDAVADLVQLNARRHLAHGITSVGDALVMPESAEAYRAAVERNRLPICIHQMRGGRQFFDAPVEAVQGAYDEDQVHDRLRGGIVKIFMDPVWPSPALTVCHSDGREEPVGTPYYSQEEVDQLVLDAAANGLQVAIHCIGNRAVEQGLNAFERALREVPQSDPRHRIEHFTYATAAQIERAASLGIIVSHQPPFLYAAGDSLEATFAETGIDAPLVPYRSMLEAGVALASGSDSPCAPVEPILGLYGLVSRRRRSDVHQIVGDEAIDALAALRTYTMGSAAAMFRDLEVGSIEPGKRADLVVLSHDPSLVDPAFIREISVQQTYVDGEFVFQR